MTELMSFQQHGWSSMACIFATQSEVCRPAACIASRTCENYKTSPTAKPRIYIFTGSIRRLPCNFVLEGTEGHCGRSHFLEGSWHPYGGMIRGQIFFNFKYFPHPSWNILFPKSEEPQIILQACTPMQHPKLSQ